MNDLGTSEIGALVGLAAAVALLIFFVIGPRSTPFWRW